ncbi:S53 family serine peptidase [Nocardioides fonticola]|uniref:S53 family serine peptidase n=1 Tax=Nocardioides fonticola TaxID=450363 RepID=A0ABP7XJ26_9ACTN
MPVPPRPLRGRLTATLAVLAAGAAIGAVPATAHARPAVSPRGWVATATRAVSYTGKRLGATAPATPVHVTLALQPHDTAAMQQRLRAIYTAGSPSYHHYLTPRQWRADYAPSRADVARVADYLRAEGFTDVRATGNRMAVTATGTAARAEHAFATRLVDFRHGTDVVFGNVTPAQVPASLAGVVSSVIGLNDLPVDLVKARRADAGSPSFNGLYPGQFATTYGATGTTTGRSVAVALLTEGDTAPVLKQLRFAEQKEKSPRVPVTVVPVGAQSTDASGAEEFDMDTQVATIAAGGVKHLYLYNIGALLDSEIVADFATFVSQDKASALSASIGGCEFNAYLDGSEVFNDVTMQEAAMQGQSIFASSGDEGDACAFVANLGGPVGVPQVEWPASGTFDTAVGGTSLVSDADGNRIQELAWLGSGGGVSELENPGWWTQDTDPAFDLEYATGGRAVPDIALDADPNLATPAEVYVDGAPVGVGGTSLSSPLMLAFWARMQAAHHDRLGLASVALYGVYDKVNPGVSQTVPTVGLPVVVPTPNPAAVPGLTDIQLGSNGLYQATPGYDLVTGLGAPDVKALTAALN